jgi:hypothetical protein
MQRHFTIGVSRHTVARVSQASAKVTPSIRLSRSIRFGGRPNWMMTPSSGVPPGFPGRGCSAQNASSTSNSACVFPEVRS